MCVRVSGSERKREAQIFFIQRRAKRKTERNHGLCMHRYTKCCSRLTLHCLRILRLFTFDEKSNEKLLG